MDVVKHANSQRQDTEASEITAKYVRDILPEVFNRCCAKTL